MVPYPDAGEVFAFKYHALARLGNNISTLRTNSSFLVIALSPYEI
ncbi:hypothetical protein GPEL0_01r0139 [Geoanaerobacter pelophilus]|uniref:Uncharacterized protein n=1 Tax=Geoanaerobacter pelophilus TaxID=60036 RepID=A0ABQ0MDX2_9BACT|nr:hypothetical protein GPEL0_01r0139 [Geoanaerobacter pelophilus]